MMKNIYKTALSLKQRRKSNEEEVEASTLIYKSR